VPEDLRKASRAPRGVAPLKYGLVRLEPSELLDLLAQAPREGTDEAARAEVRLDLPWPDGGFRTFRIEESPIMEPELAAQFPEIKTYRGQGVDDPAATARLDWTPAGFHAFVLSSGGTIYVDPHSAGDTHYIAFDKRDHPRARDGLPCLGPERAGASARESLAIAPQVTHGATLRTYRLAVAATGEYTAFHGGTVAGAMAGITTTVNRVNAIYERDLAVRLVLVAGNVSIVYTDPAGDPYTNNNGGLMLSQNQQNLDAVILSANYDIGHVFSTGGGGIAGLGVVCSSSSKARGVTGLSNPQGDGFDVDFVAHEIGHQFDAEHTFNGTSGACQGNRSTLSAYEPASGTTIMSYAGICAAEDIQPHADAYFHTRSLDEIVSHIGSANCPVATPTGNTPPVVDAGPSFTVPSRTPFTLTAVGSDGNGDTLTYTWEEFDLGAASPPNSDNGDRPLFRSFPPTLSPARTFPKLSDILANTVTLGESLPLSARTMNFRVTVRDNRPGGGGIANDAMTLSVRADSGPFLVTQPNTPVSWAAGSVQMLTWDVANTDAAPVGCTSVRISLSLDGGQSFPIVLAASTPNDGSQAVILPASGTIRARIKVEAIGNVFFDVSNANFTITPVDLIFRDAFE
jgi:hypothetical protein